MISGFLIFKNLFFEVKTVFQSLYMVCEKALIMLFFAICTAVNSFFGICKNEDVIKFLFDRGYATGVLTMQYICDFLGKSKVLLFYNIAAFNNINGDIVIDVAQDVKVYILEGGFDFDDVLLAHFVAGNIFDNGNYTVKFAKSKVMIDIHGLAGFDMV